MDKPEIDIYAYGYTEIPFDIFDALIFIKKDRIQHDLCMHILMQTYQGDGEAAFLDLNEFAFLSRTSLSWVQKRLRRLIERRIVLCMEERPGNIGIYKINPEISEWHDKRLQKVYGTDLWRKLFPLPPGQEE